MIIIMKWNMFQLTNLYLATWFDLTTPLPHLHSNKTMALNKIKTEFEYERPGSFILNIRR